MQELQVLVLLHSSHHRRSQALQLLAWRAMILKTAVTVHVEMGEVYAGMGMRLLVAVSDGERQRTS